MRATSPTPPYLPLVDVVGLKTPDAVEDHRALTAASGGQERWRAVAAIAGRHAPTHAVILADQGGFSLLADDLRRAGWSVERVRAAPSDALGYDVFALDEVPER